VTITEEEGWINHHGRSVRDAKVTLHYVYLQNLCSNDVGKKEGEYGDLRGCRLGVVVALGIACQIKSYFYAMWYSFLAGS
jgi:hypothetical protein